jgi:hypothetical protein
MKKLLLISSFVLLSGCASQPIDILIPDNTLQKDVYINNVTNNFDVQEARAALEATIELNSQDDYDNSLNSTFRGQVTGYLIEHDSRKGDDPTRNGFGRFDNAWELWSKGNTYILCVRGTVMGNRGSIIEDVIVSTIPATNFTDLPHAQVHKGFAEGAMILLTDKRQGILKYMNRIPAGSTIIITGHSQGASMAVLIQAYLHKKYGDKYKYKSYVFAQPKVGNNQFSLGFSMSNPDSWVFNNTLDIVPKVPLTVQTISDTLEDADDSDSEYYMPAGTVIGLKGHPNTTNDRFFQHHGEVYRQLFIERYGQ